MAEQSENLVFKNDDIAGLYTIDGFEVRRVFGIKRFWQGVDEIIRLYGELHPNEMILTKVDNELTKKENMNDFGSSTTGAHRKALSLPAGLLLVLKDYEPTIISNKKTRAQFMRRYPHLRACNTV